MIFDTAKPACLIKLMKLHTPQAQQTAWPPRVGSHVPMN